MPKEIENVSSFTYTAYYSQNGTVPSKFIATPIQHIGTYIIPSLEEFKQILQTEGLLTAETLYRLMAKPTNGASKPSFLGSKIQPSALKNQCLTDIENALFPYIQAIKENKKVNETDFKNAYENAVDIMETYQRTSYVTDGMSNLLGNDILSNSVPERGQYASVFRKLLNGTLTKGKPLDSNMQELASQLFALCVETTPDGGTYLRAILSQLKPVFESEAFSKNGGSVLYAALRDAEKELSKFIHPINLYNFSSRDLKEKEKNASFLKEFSQLKHIQSLAKQHAQLVAQFAILTGTHQSLVPQISSDVSLARLLQAQQKTGTSYNFVDESYKNVQHHAEYLTDLSTFFANMYKMHDDASFAYVFVRDKESMLRFLTTKQLTFQTNPLKPEETESIDVEPMYQVETLKKQSGGILSKLFKKKKDTYLDDAEEFISIFEQLEEQYPDSSPDELFAKATETFLKSKNVDAQTIANITSQLQQTAGIER